MDEKKRKKAKKKHNNKCAQSGNAHEASAELEGALEAFREIEEVSLASDSTSGQKNVEAQPSEAARATRDLGKEFQLLVQDLKSSLETETVNSQALLQDLKNSISGLQASLESPVKKLGEEVLQLKESTQQQRKKEVDLGGGINNLQEEIRDLKALQEHQQEREEAKHLELQQLREEICSLREYNIQQFEKVEEMNTMIKQLLLERSQLTRTGSADGHTQVLATGFSSQESPLEVIEMSGSIGEPADNGGSAMMILGEAKGNHQVVKNDYLNFVPDEMVPEAQVPGMEAQARAALTVDDGSYIKECPTLVENYLTGQSIDGPVSQDCDDTYVETGGVVNEGDIQQEPQHISSAVHHQRGLTPTKEIKPFSDAPITGAPIRLFGFIARYVSGSDLVRR